MLQIELVGGMEQLMAKGCQIVGHILHAECGVAGLRVMVQFVQGLMNHGQPASPGCALRVGSHVRRWYWRHALAV